MKSEFRPATVDDLELLLAWRNHPKIYEQFSAQEGPIDWEEHADWWKSRRERRDWIISVKENGSRRRDVGSVNVTNLHSNEPEVGVFVGEIPIWGRGVATEAVKFALDWLVNRDYDGACATILEENDASIALFEKIGFSLEERVGDEIVYWYSFD